MSSKATKESIRDFKRRMLEQKKMADEVDQSNYLQDQYEKSMNCIELQRKITGIIYHDDMATHKCVWDDNYPEKPERYTAIMDRISELGLLVRTKRIQIETYDPDEILRMHSRSQLEKLEEISKDFDIEKAEEAAKQYDAIYFNKETYHCALMSVNATLSLTDAIINGAIQNGMAIVRPPGHHAQHNNYNGYCYFNNVAIAAQHLRMAGKANKILIVDFDVHHGQGTQQMFYGDENILYFSIHRYEYGTFWPNLRESSFDFIGEGRGLGYNINVPLNVTGLGDAEYMAIVLNILLPVAYEFQPDMILFSAGYDACIGCPEGEMKVSPGFYGHLIKLLSGLADGKLAVILEGGYFLPSLAEGAAMTLRALMDDKPAFLPPLGLPHADVIKTINNLKFVLHDYWKCFKAYELFDLLGPCGDSLHPVVVRYDGDELLPPFETRNCYPVQSSTIVDYNTLLVEDYKTSYGQPKPNQVCYTYHDDMLLHKSKDDKIENPQRLNVVYNRFKELELHQRCFKIKGANVDVEDLAKSVHNVDYIDKIMNDNYMLDINSSDLYWIENGSKISIHKAVTSLIGICDEIMSGNYSSGAAIIRPPGHHAESDKSLGFCFINNVAIAAKYLINKHQLQRVMIIDFDIHHGNGTQKIFYDTNKVLYLSIHKFEQGLYFPCNEDGATTQIGTGIGEGYNINIPFDQERMGDTDYLTAFFRCILPIAYSYAPEIILVSAGFDAGINDLLGNYKVQPETFGHFIQLLKPLASGQIVLAMEGGYNLNTLKHSMNFCIKTLLGDPLPKLKLDELKYSAQSTFKEVISIQKKYWPVLGIDQMLPKQLSAVIIKNKYQDLTIDEKNNDLAEIRKNLQGTTICQD